MALITRTGKGSKLTIEEMDGNLLHLQGTYHDNGNSSENTNIDWSNGTLQEINLDNDPTLTFSNGVVGQGTSLLLKQTQPGVASINWPSNVKWSNGLAPKFQSIGAGKIDSSFNTGSGFSGSNGYTWDVAVQNDGKILIAGDYSSYNGYPMECLVRINPDGSIDGGFKVVQGFTGAFNFVMSLAVQPDGKIIAVGFFTQYNGSSGVNIARLNPDGSVDGTFNSGTGFTGNVPAIGAYGVAVQSDGKIVVVGQFTEYNGNSRVRIARLNADGSVDGTFNPGGGFNVQPALGPPDIQPDGKIVVVGGFTSYNSLSANRIIRLNPDATVDGTFNTGTGFDSNPEGSAIQSDGKIIVVGSFTSYNGTPINRIVRLNTDGTLDNTFNVGTGFNDTVQVVKTQSDGKIICSGTFTQYNGTLINTILRLNTDGTLDSTFNPGEGFNSSQWGIDIQDDGKILIAGWSKYFDNSVINGIVRINSETTDAYNIINFNYDGTYYIGSY